MKQIYIGVIIVVMAIAANVRATMVTLTFEDLGAGRGNVPAGYGGLNWSAGDWEYTDEYQDVYTRSSPPTAIMCNAGTSKISFGQTVNFKSVWVAAYNRALNYPATFILEGRLNGQSVGWSNQVLTGAGHNILIDVDWTVDEIVEHAEYYEPGSPGMWFFLLDDLKFDPNPVPEPVTLSLLAMGGLTLARRHRTA